MEEKKELKDLEDYLLENKIVYLLGRTEAGKTRIALEYREKYRYKKLFFIDCRSQESFDKGLKELAQSSQYAGSTLDKGRDILARTKNSLLILDGVDRAKLADWVQSLLDVEVAGHVIITGRYPLSSDRFPRFRIFEAEVETDELSAIFNQHLSPHHQKIFEQLEQKDKEKLISVLGRSLALIEIAAETLGFLWKHPDQPKDLTSLINKVSSLEPKTIHELMQGNAQAYEDSIKAVREAVGGPSLDEKMVDFVLYFYAFHFMHNRIALPVGKEALRDLLINLTKKNDQSIDVPGGSIKISWSDTFDYIYEAESHEDIYSAFLRVTIKLHEQGLIDMDEKGVWIPLSLRWWVIDDFYKSADKIFLEQVTPKLKQIGKVNPQRVFYGTLEKRFAWYLSGFRSYLDQISKSNKPDIQQLSLLIGFLELVKKFNLSLELQSEIINGLHLWNETKVVLQQWQKASSPLSLKEIQTLSFEQLEILCDQLLQEGGKYIPETLALLERLGNDCEESNPAKAEKLLLKAKVAGSQQALVQLGCLYQWMAKREKDPKQADLLEKANNEYSLFLEKKEDSNGSVHYDRAQCYPKNGEGFKKAVLDLEKAVEIDPSRILYRLSLAHYLKEKGDPSRAGREELMANGLSHMEKTPKPISKEYKDLILEFLQADKKFEWDEYKKRWRGHTMKDRGVLFGEMLLYHPSIEEVLLHGCHLSDEGMEAIAKSLATNKSIKTLRLDWNNEVTGRGIRALSDALKANRQISELSLRNSNKIAVADILYLIDLAPSQLKINLSGSAVAKDHPDEIEKRAKAKGIKVILKE